MQITIYSTSTCPYCKMLKSYLAEKNISFEEKMVDSDDAAREQMSKLSDGFLGVPFVIIDKGNSQIEKVIGFDKNRLNQILGIN